MRLYGIGLSLFLFVVWAEFQSLSFASPMGPLTPAQRGMATIQSKTTVPDDWPMDRHDSRNTGLSADEIAPPLRLLWKAPGQYPFSLLISSGGVVAVIRLTKDKLRTGEVALYDRAGRCMWQLASAVPYYIKDSHIVVGVKKDEESVPTCYDWRANKALWSQPKASQLGTVIAQDGHLYIAPYAEPALLWMLDLENGQVLHECSIPDYGSGALACDGALLFRGTSQWMHVLDAQSLERQWAYYGAANVHPMRVGSLLITQGNGHWTTTLDLSKKKESWGIRAWRDSAHALAVGTGGRQVLVEAIASPEQVAAFDVTTGKVLWHHPLIVTNAPAAGSGHFVYVPGSHRNKKARDGIQGGFYCLDAATGKLKWKYEQPGIYGTSIIVSDGRVYGLDNQGTLYCFAPAKSH